MNQSMSIKVDPTRKLNVHHFCSPRITDYSLFSFSWCMPSEEEKVQDKELGLAYSSRPNLSWPVSTDGMKP